MGIKSRDEALALARDRELDLVEVSPAASPPVCKLIDYKKYKYLQQKKQKVLRATQKTGVLKEVKLRPKIGAHDLEVKKNHIQEFLQKERKVKIMLQFFGRERQHVELGRELLDKLIESVGEYGQPDAPPKRSKNSVIVILTPKKLKKQC